MVIAIAGKNNIAVNALEYLALNYSQHKIVAVCNKDDLGVNLWQRSLRLCAKNLNIEEVTLDALYSVEDLLFISLEYADIINPARFVSDKLYNIHFSELPKYKGMYTSVMPILNNERRSGVTLHRMEPGIDTGDILAQKVFDLGIDDTASDLYNKYLTNAFELFKENIDELVNGYDASKEIKQDAELSTYYSKKALDFKNICIDLKQTAIAIHNQIRAFNFRQYQLCKVFDMPVVNSIITQNKSKEKCGSVIFETEEEFVIATIDYDLVIIKDCFKKVIDACKENNLDELKKIKYLSYVINEKEEHGWTPIVISVYNGNLEMTKYLEKMGARLDIVNNNGTNLLMYAKDNYKNSGSAETFEYLYNKGLRFEQKDFYGKDLYEYCEEQGIEKIGNIVAKKN